jgi:hypothetical protein
MLGEIDEYCVEQNAKAMEDKTEAEAPPRRGGLQRIYDNGNRAACPDLEIGARPAIRTGIGGASVRGDRDGISLLRGWRERNVPFYQTNPPIFDWNTAFIVL